MAVSSWFAVADPSRTRCGGYAAGDSRALYMQYCASCHGTRGDGKEPLASTLTTPPANLRILSQSLRKSAAGRRDREIHRRSVRREGARAARHARMGAEILRESGGDEAEVKELITKLVSFLQSIQTGTASLKIEMGAK